MTALACVEMEATVKRKRNTGDSAHDINLDYANTYQMHAAIGRMADTADLTLQLGTVEVDFTQFDPEESFAHHSLSAVTAGLVCALASTLIF